jgi:hypothetical protein
MEKIINVHGINMEIYFIIYLMILISNRNIGIFCINLFGVKIVYFWTKLELHLFCGGGGGYLFLEKRPFYRQRILLWFHVLI